MTRETGAHTRPQAAYRLRKLAANTRDIDRGELLDIANHIYLERITERTRAYDRGFADGMRSAYETVRDYARGALSALPAGGGERGANE